LAVLLCLLSLWFSAIHWSSQYCALSILPQHFQKQPTCCPDDEVCKPLSIIGQYLPFCIVEHNIN
jgi:hypothetical protein